MALVSHLWFGHKMLAAYNVHLESRTGDDLRRSQLGELLNDTRRYDAGTAVILAGDFNFDVSEQAAASCIRQMQFDNPFNHDAEELIRRDSGRNAAIDWVLTRSSLDISAAQVHSSVRASDHYPLSLTLRLS